MYRKQFMVKAVALSMAVAMAGTSVTCGMMPKAIYAQTDVTEEAAKKIIVNDSFIDGTDGWYGMSGTDGIVTIDGNPCMSISNRSAGWQALAKRIEGQVVNGAIYKVTCKVRLNPEVYTNGEVMKINVGTTHKDSTMSGEDYDKFINDWSSNSVMANASEWTTIETTIEVSFNGELEKLELKVGAEDAVSSYVIDDVVVEQLTEGTAGKEIVIQEDIPDLKDTIFSEESIGGKAGVAISPNALGDPIKMKLVTKHFNSISTENEMKPEYFLGQTPTIDAEGNLVLSFEHADKMMEYVKEYNSDQSGADKIGVRGHVLLWHTQTPEWFYHEGFDANNALLSKEAMLNRLEWYITSVIDHFETNYPGIIYEWDVVNEQIEPGDYDASANPFALRKHHNGQVTSYYKIFDGDPIYVINAFKYAKAALEKNGNTDTKLVYNDYGETNPEKCKYICKLLKEINKDGTYVDIMGMQAHYSMGGESEAQIESAIRAYSECVSGIHLTEFDMQSSKTYDGSNQDVEYTKMGYRYKNIHDLLTRLDKEDGIDIVGWTFWGLYDKVSWLHSQSSAGGGADGSRKQCPLLFDDDMQAKPTYWGIVDPTQLEPIVNTVNANYAEDLSVNNAEVMEIAGPNETADVKVSWSEAGMKVQVEIPKSMVSDAQAKVNIYFNSDVNSNETVNAITIAKADWIDAGDCYVASSVIAKEQFAEGGLAVNKSVKLDVKLVDGEHSYSWNDLKNSQDETGKYYGILVLKPYAVIGKGTITVDAEEDDLWTKVEGMPLSIVLGGKNEATVKALWDEDCLYVYYDVKDSEIATGIGEPYNQDSVEVFLDQNNGKTGTYQEDDAQYRVGADNAQSFNGAKCNAENIVSATRLTADGYVVELAIKWTDIVPEENAKIGVEFQVNDGKTGGSRLGTISWYDNSGNGWQNPGVFGTATLGAAVEEETTTPGEDVTTPEEETTDPGEDVTTPEEEETTTPEEDETPSEEEATPEDTTKKPNDSVATGDQNPMALWMMLASIAAAVSVVVRRKKVDE